MIYKNIIQPNHAENPQLSTAVCNYEIMFLMMRLKLILVMTFQVAKAFVAVVLAESMARYISQHESNNCPNGHVGDEPDNSTARKAAAKASAQAARAAQSGDPEAAAKAVIAAVKAVDDVNNNKKAKTRIKSPNKSKFCVIL